MQSHLNDAIDAYPDNESYITLQLDELQSMRDHLETLNGGLEEAISEVLSPEQIDEIQQLKIKFGLLVSEQESIVRNQENIVKELVDEFGSSVKGGTLHAVYSQGRISWDTKGLNGYAVAHPEVNEFVKQGKPSVSIRKVK